LLLLALLLLARLPCGTLGRDAWAECHGTSGNSQANR
jgi:hypothetical protein